MLAGLGVGYWLDGWLGTRPWLLLLGSLLGIAVGLYGFLRRYLPAGKSGDGAGP